MNDTDFPRTKGPWPCKCFLCHELGVLGVFAVRARDVSLFGEGPQVKGSINLRLETDPANGHDVYLMRGLPDAPLNLYGPDWVRDMAVAQHYPTRESAECAAFEAVALYPHLIGAVDVLQFGIR
jgi:hypothetical protein